jgi:hypothetical protein
MIPFTAQLCACALMGAFTGLALVAIFGALCSVCKWVAELLD